MQLPAWALKDITLPRWVVRTFVILSVLAALFVLAVAGGILLWAMAMSGGF